MNTRNDGLPAFDTFPERLTWALKNAKMSKSSLARAVGVSPQAIQKVCTKGYGGRHAKKMAEALGFQPHGC
jgi:transcriptional regulator with XRE-family HTH domain